MFEHAAASAVCDRNLWSLKRKKLWNIVSSGMYASFTCENRGCIPCMARLSTAARQASE